MAGVFVNAAAEDEGFVAQWFDGPKMRCWRHPRAFSSAALARFTSRECLAVQLTTQQAEVLW